MKDPLSMFKAVAKSGNQTLIRTVNFPTYNKDIITVGDENAMLLEMITQVWNLTSWIRSQKFNSRERISK